MAENFNIEKVCPICGATFGVPRSHAWRRKCCSLSCYAINQHERVVSKYPPEEEVRRLYEDDGLTDRDLGRHFGHSYQWALGVRRHYGIAGRKKGARAKPLHQKRDRERWSIDRKRESGCRNCGKVGRLHLHHAVPRSIAPSGKYDLRNGVPLCTACHLGWHNGVVVLPRDLFTAEEWAFIETLIGPVWLDKRYPELVAA